MRFFTILTFTCLFMFGCGNSRTLNLPSAPANIETVTKIINGREYKTADLALISNLISDKNNPYEWFDEIRDTTAFFRNYKKERMKFSLNFINDSTAEVTDNAGLGNGAWKVDDQPRNDETAGVFLRILMIKKTETLLPGQTGPATMTYSYKVLGIDDKQIFLETTNMFNMRKLAVLMKTE